MSGRLKKKEQKSEYVTVEGLAERNSGKYFLKLQVVQQYSCPGKFSFYDEVMARESASI